MKAELLEMMQLMITTKYEQVQSIDKLIEYGMTLAQYNARSGQIASEAKGKLHTARKTAFKAASERLKAEGKKVPVMLLRDYVNDLCAEENEVYELADRTNRATVHSMDLIRTSISALKAERTAVQFGGGGYQA